MKYKRVISNPKFIVFRMQNTSTFRGGRGGGRRLPSVSLCRTTTSSSLRRCAWRLRWRPTRWGVRICGDHVRCPVQVPPENRECRFDRLGFREVVQRRRALGVGVIEAADAPRFLQSAGDVSRQDVRRSCCFVASLALRLQRKLVVPVNAAG